MAQIDLVIADESETIPHRSWLDLVPTIRAKNSEIWIIYNPCRRDSWVAESFDTDLLPPRTMVVDINYSDNPWFPIELEEQRKHAQATMRPEVYAHVWLGAYLDRSDAQIFKDKYRVADFKPQPEWGQPLQGLDFGFSQDPTAAVKCWAYDGRLYIEYSAGKVGLELDDTSAFIVKQIPEFDRFPIIADSARPESISHLKRHGLPKIEGAQKGKGSV
jgi:phage terminase large subunit